MHDCMLLPSLFLQGSYHWLALGFNLHALRVTPCTFSQTPTHAIRVLTCIWTFTHMCLLCLHVYSHACGANPCSHIMHTHAHVHFAHTHTHTMHVHLHRLVIVEVINCHSNQPSTCWGSPILGISAYRKVHNSPLWLHDSIRETCDSPLMRAIAGGHWVDLSMHISHVSKLSPILSVALHILWKVHPILRSHDSSFLNI